MEPVDLYCERTGPEFWGEPVNALSNAAFLLAAVLAWRRWGQDPLCAALALVLAVIGIGSFLFHTFATSWAAAADVLPILGFILLYVWAAQRRFWGQGRLVSGLFTAATLPWIAVLAPVFAALPGFRLSAVYWPVPLLILIHAGLLHRRRPALAQGLAAGAGILCLSLVFRSLDGVLCGVVPMGTHVLWHLLNALMLGWMIELLGRHGVAASASRR